MAVDQRVLLLKSGNDIDLVRVGADLMAYNQHEHYESLRVEGGERYLDFGESNAFVITNANEGEYNCMDLRIDDHLDHSNLKDFAPFNETENEDASAYDEPRIRKLFPETWLFEDIVIDESGQHIMKPHVPDTMTSWIITGFAIHPDIGLGIAQPRSLTVKQEFFIVFDLPYSIKLNEIFKIPVTIFNEIPKNPAALNVEVTLFNEDAEFDFVNVDSAAGNCKLKEIKLDKQMKTVSVKSMSIGSTFFAIKALKVGLIKLRIKATSPRAGDQVERALLVEPEGITTYENKPLLIDLRETNFYSYNFDVVVAPDAIQNSIMFEALVVGDLLGPALDNINALM